jgi:hypothetical protein
MNPKIPETGVILWGGMRQLQSLREGMVSAIAGLAILDNSTVGVLKWLKEQGLGEVEPNTLRSPRPPSPPHRVSDERSTTGTPPSEMTEVPPAVIFLRILATGLADYRHDALGKDRVDQLRRGQLSAQTEDDHGSERSGAGWANGANFCITSAFIRVLGAWEQYELDVLKALVHYRPTGKKLGPLAEQLLIVPDMQVVLESPRTDPEHPNKMVFELTPEWYEIRKDVGNNVARAKHFSRVYSIDAIPGSNKNEKTANRELRDNWYDKRNKIAHGREEVVMTLAEFTQVEVFVYRSMESVASQCLNGHNLVV